MTPTTRTTRPSRPAPARAAGFAFSFSCLFALAPAGCNDGGHHETGDDLSGGSPSTRGPELINPANRPTSAGVTSGTANDPQLPGRGAGRNDTSPNPTSGANPEAAVRP